MFSATLKAVVLHAIHKVNKFYIIITFKQSLTDIGGKYNYTYPSK